MEARHHLAQIAGQARPVDALLVVVGKADFHNGGLDQHLAPGIAHHLVTRAEVHPEDIVGVLVERSSRLVMLIKLADATAASALEGFTAKLRSIAEPMRQTLTYDQGKEMRRHQQLAANTGVKVYFCDPHSPGQRGTCENTYGLLRQYLPKRADLSVYSQNELDASVDSLNTRPRATHGFNTPLAVFDHLLAMAQQPSTSIH